MSSEIKRLAKMIQGMDQRIKDLAKPQLAHSAIEGGAIIANDDAGNERMRIGMHADGTNTITHVQGPPPPAPTAPEVTADLSMITVRWDGNFDGDRPADWDRVDVHVSPISAFTPTQETLRGSIVSQDGGDLTLRVTGGTWYVGLIAVSRAETQSEPSEQTSVTVEGITDKINAEIDAAEKRVEQARKTLEDALAENASNLEQARKAFEDALADLMVLKDVTLPGLAADVDAAEGRLSAAEGQISEAAEALAKVPDQISQAREDAVSAARSETTRQVSDAQQELEERTAAVQARADEAVAAANGRNQNYFSVSDPSGTGTTVGDVWYRYTSDWSGVIGMWRWDGQNWRTYALEDQVVASVDAGKISAGYLDVANRIQAGSILAEKLFIGSDRNAIPNGDFAQDSTVGWPPAAARQTTDKPDGLPAAITFPAGHGTFGNGFPLLQVQPGDEVLFQCWIKADKPNSRIYIEARDQNGVQAARSGYLWSPRYGDTAVHVAGSYEVPTEWTLIESSLRVAPGITGIKIDSIHLNHSAGSERNASVSLAGVRLAVKTGGIFIGNGSVQTPHLAADVMEVGNLKAGQAAVDVAVARKLAAETAQFINLDVKNLVATGSSKLADVVAQCIAADTASFLKLNVGNLVADTTTMNTAVINKLFSDVVVARMAQAQEFIGENAILTGAVTAPKITASEELTAKIAEFLKIKAGQIEADAIDGMTLTGATVRTAASGQRVNLDASGLTIYGPGEQLRAKFPTTGDKAVVDANITARSLESLGASAFRGNVEVASGTGRVTLETGVPAPSAPPAVEFRYHHVSPPPLESNERAYGLAWLDNRFWRYVDAVKSADGDRIESINPTTGLVESSFPMTDKFWAGYGLTAVGGRLYALGEKSGVYYKVFVRVFEPNGTLVKEWEYKEVGWSPSNPFTFKPGIGTDGTNIVIAHCADRGELVWRKFNRDTGALISVHQDTADRTRSDVTGIYVGSADFGKEIALIGKRSRNRLEAFTPNGTYAGTTMGAPSYGEPAGLCWDGNNFWSITDAGRITRYERKAEKEGKQYEVAYTFADDSLRETTASPRTEFTWPSRATPWIISTEMPTEATNVKAYIADGNGFLRLYPIRQSEGTAHELEPTTGPVWMDNAQPPVQNKFPSLAPAELRSALGGLVLRGDGTAQIGPWEFGEDKSVVTSSAPPNLELVSASTAKIGGGLSDTRFTSSGWIDHHAAESRGHSFYINGETVVIIRSGNLESVGGVKVGNQKGSGTANAQLTAGGWVIRQASSSRRYKTDITPTETNVNALLQLDPVRFTYKADIERRRRYLAGEELHGADLDLGSREPETHYGLIAEQVHDLGLTDLVVYDDQGRVESVKYDRLAVALLDVVKHQEQRLQAIEEHMGANND